MRLLLLLLLIFSAVLASAGPELHRLSKHRAIRQVKRLAAEQDDPTAICGICGLLVGGLNQMVQQNKTDIEIEQTLISLCDGIGFEPSHICKHIIEVYTSMLVFVLKNADINPNEICGAFFPECGNSDFPLSAMWNVSIPGGKPPIQKWPKIPNGRPTYKVLHLTDIHIDRQYAVGSEAYCQLDNSFGRYALCCRNYADDSLVSRPNTKKIRIPAGPWGMPNICDLPYQTFESALEHISTTHTDVHIISHIPPGDDYCLKGWSFNYFEIVKRFEKTIAEQFYAHTHNDHFQVYYDPADNMRPFHFNWITPSLTTFEFNNPSYRIYTIDGGYQGATYTVKDAETYFANVTEANANNKPPIWRLEYNTRQFYNMTDFSPQSWSDLSDRLWEDKQLFRQFIKYYYRNDYNSECYNDDSCRRNFVCAMKKARSYDESFCDSLK
ncbi:Saposin-like type B, region 1 [Oesophagostomum dentatum]|uniref:Saposin-like type B, region 1 n=1 Tax=Oesophagostomum dentatum TaxID=61180 RepID=A0A0B1TH07_OESDE|nr:Saposin-like type B, region 1 [Oesophagostomum dentatum]